MGEHTLELTAEIVAAFVSHNPIAASGLPGLILTVHRALSGASDGAANATTGTSQTPAVPIRRSIKPDHLICLEDGRKLKSLKRHLQAEHNMDPVSYRAKWGLRADYPMVAASYSVTRSTLAKAMGLGGSGKRPAAAAQTPATPEPLPGSAKAKRRRRTVRTTDARPRRSLNTE